MNSEIQRLIKATYGHDTKEPKEKHVRCKRNLTIRSTGVPERSASRRACLGVSIENHEALHQRPRQLRREHQMPDRLSPLPAGQRVGPGRRQGAQAQVQLLDTLLLEERRRNCLPYPSS